MQTWLKGGAPQGTGYSRYEGEAEKEEESQTQLDSAQQKPRGHALHNL